MTHSRTMLATLNVVLVCVLIVGFTAAGRERVAFAQAQQTAPPNAHNGKIAFAGTRLRGGMSSFGLEIYTVNPDGSGLVEITNNSASDMEPAWSPDGKKIAFMRHVRGGDEDVYVMNADGRGQKRLTDESGDDSYPTWSPDGTKIAFMSNRANSIDIFIMDADGSNVRRLTNNGRANVNPSWSTDGTKFAFQSQALTPASGNSGIYTINVDGTGEQALTNSRSDFLPDWSPDGRRIVFQGNSGIYVMNSNGTQRRKILPGSGDPAWSPDGKRIVFLSGDAITTSNPDGSCQTTVTSPQGLALLGPDWQPLAGAGTGNAGNGTPTDCRDGNADGANEPGGANTTGAVINHTTFRRHLPDTGGATILAPVMGLLLIGGAVARSVVRKR